MTDHANTVREALTGEHRAGTMQPDRGDGLHWLTCIDCGNEWAEKEDGSHGGGEMECKHRALAALDALVAERDEARRDIATLDADLDDRNAALATAEAEREEWARHYSGARRRAEAAEAEVARLNHENAALEAEGRNLREALAHISSLHLESDLYRPPAWARIARAALAAKEEQ